MELYYCSIERAVESWKAVQANIPNYEEVVGRLLFQQIFQLAPDAISLYGFGTEIIENPKLVNIVPEHVYNLPSFVTHAKHVVSMLETALTMMIKRELGNLSLALQSLGARHVEYGVKPPHYNIVETALLRTLQLGLGGNGNGNGDGEGDEGAKEEGEEDEQPQQQGGDDANTRAITWNVQLRKDWAAIFKFIGKAMQSGATKEVQIINERDNEENKREFATLRLQLYNKKAKSLSHTTQSSSSNHTPKRSRSFDGAAALLSFSPSSNHSRSSISTKSSAYSSSSSSSSTVSSSPKSSIQEMKKTMKKKTTTTTTTKSSSTTKTMTSSKQATKSPKTTKKKMMMMNEGGNSKNNSSSSTSSSSSSSRWKSESTPSTTAADHFVQRRPSTCRWDSEGSSVTSSGGRHRRWDSECSSIADSVPHRIHHQQHRRRSETSSMSCSSLPPVLPTRREIVEDAIAITSPIRNGNSISVPLRSSSSSGATPMMTASSSCPSFMISCSSSNNTSNRGIAGHEYIRDVSPTHMLRKLVNTPTTSRVKYNHAHPRIHPQPQVPKKHHNRNDGSDCEYWTWDADSAGSVGGGGKSVGTESKHRRKQQQQPPKQKYSNNAVARTKESKTKKVDMSPAAMMNVPRRSILNLT